MLAVATKLKITLEVDCERNFSLKLKNAPAVADMALGKIAMEESASGNVLNLNACTHAFVFIPIIFGG